jgi:hypothetical protein
MNVYVSPQIIASFNTSELLGEAFGDLGPTTGGSHFHFHGL